MNAKERAIQGFILYCTLPFQYHLGFCIEQSLEFEQILLWIYIGQMVRFLSCAAVAFLAFLLYSATAAPSILTFFDDSLEFQLVAPTLGIAHPTGYPLYTLLGALWSRVLFPIGNWAWRMNMFSAFAAAIAVGILFDLGLRLLQMSNPDTRSLNAKSLGIESTDIHSLDIGDEQRSSEVRPSETGAQLWTRIYQRVHQWGPAVVSATCFAITPTWWQQATVAEVYALHGLFVALILRMTIAVADVWRHASPLATDANSAAKNPSRFLLFRQMFRPNCTWLALIIGLSLAHHRTTLLLLPGIGLYLLLAAPALFRPQIAWLRWLIALVLPLSLYLYIPIRSQMGAVDLNGSYQNSLSGFFSHVNASAYTTFFGWNDQTWPIFVQQFSWWGILWGIAGGIGILLIQWANRAPTTSVSMTSVSTTSVTESSATTIKDLAGQSTWREWILICITFMSSFLFSLYYRVADVAVFMVPAYLCWALWMGAGYRCFVWLTVWTKTSHGTAYRTKPTDVNTRRVSAGIRVPAWGTSVGYCLVAFFIGVSPLLYNRVTNRSQEWNAHDVAVAMAKVPFPSDSIFIGLEGEATAIKYMQQSENLGPSVTALWANEPQQRISLVNDWMAQGRPLYLTRELAGIEEAYSFTSHGPLIRVWPRGSVETREPRYALDIPMLDDALLLKGVDVDIMREAGGPSLQATYFWLPRKNLSQRIKLSIRLQDGENGLHYADGSPVTVDEFPLHQASYSTNWLPNETIWDTHKLPLPRLDTPLPTDDLNLNTIIYDADSLQELGRVVLPIPSWLE